jgi:uncharacterized protein YbcC (UPF0753/DUF2309 family)
VTGVQTCALPICYEVTFPITDYRKLHIEGRIIENVIDRIIKQRKGDKEFEYWKNVVLNKKFDNSFAPKIGRLRSSWKSILKFDLDSNVQPLLFRILSSYLDQGIALWHFPNEEKGLISALKILEKNSLISFFKSKRVKQLLIDDECSIEKLLKILVGKSEYFEQYIFDQQFSHRGWSGMVSSIESHPDVVLYPKKITLHDLIILDLLFEIDVLDTFIGNKWKPLCEYISFPPTNLFEDIKTTEYQEVLSIWQDAFEWSYYEEVLSGLKYAFVNKEKEIIKNKSFQSVFCIDEREDSIRRHIESCDNNSETLGCPGFFGVEFYFQPQNGKFYEKLCPAPVTPKYLVKEYDVKEKRKHEFLYIKQSHHFFLGFFISIFLGGLAAIKMIQNLLFQKMSPANSNAFTHMSSTGKLHYENKSNVDRDTMKSIKFIKRGEELLGNYKRYEKISKKLL